MSKLMLAVPCRIDGSVDAHLVEWLLSVKIPGWEIVRTLVKDGPVVQARNALMKKYRASDCDAMMTIDSDQIPKRNPQDATGGLETLLGHLERDDVDVVNIVTVRGSEEGPVIVLNRLRDDMACELHEDILGKPAGLHRMDEQTVVGGAGILMKRHVADRFWEENVPWFYDVVVRKRDEHFSKQDGRDLFGERLIGHDYWFFKNCHRFGLQCWIDTSVFWGHAKSVDMRGEYLRSLKLKTKIKELVEATA